MDRLLFSKLMLGGFAGLIAWLLQASFSLSFGLATHGLVTLMAAAMALFGVVVCGANTAAEGHYELTRIDPVDVLFSIFVGGLLGAGAGTLVAQVTPLVVPSDQQADKLLTDVVWFASWVIVGAGIGIGTALRVRHHSNERLKNGVFGGVLGGLAGGLIYAVALQVELDGWAKATLQAASYAAVGAAVAAGIGIAPALAAKATLRFIKSDSYGARRKLTLTPTWPLEKDPCVLGRSPMGTAEIHRVFVVPDEKAADLHAVIRYEDGRFKLYYPAENFDRAGKPKNLVYSQGVALSNGAVLRNGMRLLVGSTELEFNLKKDEAA